MIRKQPLVSIGLPVYNGENFLSEGIESILKQTYSDFELIIFDNSSTDRTAEICKYYETLDQRIQYYRNPSNVGAAANFNLTFKVSRGKYFKWAAHDDICKSTFLEKCVTVLESNKDVVLAYTKTMELMSDTGSMIPYDRKLPTDSVNPARRFGSILGSHRCYEVFGLIRHEALVKTPLMGAYSNGDGVLLGRLAILGRFVQVPEYLFVSRRHQEQSHHMVNDRKSWAVWFNPKLSGKISLPHWKSLFEHFRSVTMYPLSWPERVLCMKHFYWNLRHKKMRDGLLTDLFNAIRLQ